ncbi:PLP-dependent transferase [Oscillospiraceae bacterium HV4-5-C5C]|nr:PLP-dependent transferase [Oscillospiraceae bacterium HV4-5-C5C]
MEQETRCIHLEQPTKYELTGSISMPIYQTATFAHPELGRSSGFDYSRLENPTREQLQNIVAGLEYGQSCRAFSTGMAAISALMELFSPGDHIVVSDDLYGGSYRLFNTINQKNGLNIEACDTSDLEQIKAALTDQTKAVFIETPTNPMMHVSDIAAIAELCHRYQARLIVDNTFLSPYFQNPLLLGADIVVHSGTKYLGGHNDTLAGFLICKDAATGEELKQIQCTTGACLAPFDAWLILRGIKTLAVRMTAQQERAEALADWLQGQPHVTKLYYPGLTSHPAYNLSKRQSRGSGAMLSFRVDTAETARQLLGRVRLIQFAESLGGVETLLTYPMTQTHAAVPESLREKLGIDDCLLRLSVGLEAVQDLKDDLAAALK